MEFKIDTKATYSTITPPAAHLNAIMTEAIRQKWHEQVATGCQNMVIDLENCPDASEDGIESLLQLHEDIYSNGWSMVITGLTGKAAQDFKTSDAATMLNVAPTMAEAIDIINMEILERDMLNEE